MSEPNIGLLSRIVKETARQREELDSRQKVIETPQVPMPVIDFSIYQCSGALTLTNVYQDVASVAASITPAINEYAIVWLTTAWNLANGTAACNASDNLQGQLQLNGVGQSILAGMLATGSVGNASVTRMYRLSLDAGTAYTIKLQARNATGNRGECGVATQMGIMRVAR